MSFSNLGLSDKVLAAVRGVKIIRQPNVENQQRHGDAENSIAEGVETRL